MEPSRPSHGLWRGLLVVVGMACGIHLAASQMYIDTTLLQYVEGDEALLLLVSVPGDATNVSWYRGSEPKEETLIMNYLPLDKTWHKGPLFSGRENMTENYLIISKAELSDTGNYTAKVVSKNGVQTATAMLRVGEFYLKPDLTVNTSSAVEYLDVVAANCKTNTTKIKWYLSDTLVSNSDRMTLSPDNKTLVIHRISRSDTWIECKVTNSADLSQSSAAHLSVFYGPDSINLMTNPYHLKGVLRADLGSRVEISCRVSISQPVQYRWTHYNGLLNVSGSSITLQSLTEKQLGRYRCTVENPRTKIVLYQDVWVQKPWYIPDPKDGFRLAKPLEVFLIVLAVLGGISVCGTLIYTLHGHCSNRMDGTTPVPTSEL